MIFCIGYNKIGFIHLLSWNHYIDVPVAPTVALSMGTRG